MQEYGWAPVDGVAARGVVTSAAGAPCEFQRMWGRASPFVAGAGILCWARPTRPPDRVWLPIGLTWAWYFTQGGSFFAMGVPDGAGYFLWRVIARGARSGAIPSSPRGLPLMLFWPDDRVPSVPASDRPNVRANLPGP